MRRKIRKKDRRIVEFDMSRIANVVVKAFIARKMIESKHPSDEEVLEKLHPGNPDYQEGRNDCTCKDQQEHRSARNCRRFHGDPALICSLVPS